MRVVRIAVIALVLLSLATSIGVCGTQKVAGTDITMIPLAIRTGLLSNTTGAPQQVFEYAIDLHTAAWMQVWFTGVNLGPDDQIILEVAGTGNRQVIYGSQVRPDRPYPSVSLAGGIVNVYVILMPGSIDRSLQISSAAVPAEIQSPAEICGAVDDRVPVAPDPQCVARVVDKNKNWGSGFMIDANWMLTAGHVMTDGPWEVQFNVPPSNAVTGAINPPAAIDIFPVPNPPTGTINNGGFGNDWAVIQVPNNGNRNPGANCVMPLSCAPPPALNAVLKGDGYGTDNQPARNGVLQTETGPCKGVLGTFVLYEIDTEGGNSGGPIVNGSGDVVAIHTNGGCQTPWLQANGGTLITNAQLQAAIAVLIPGKACAPENRVDPDETPCITCRHVPFMSPWAIAGYAFLLALVGWYVIRRRRLATREI